MQYVTALSAMPSCALIWLSVTYLTSLDWNVIMYAHPTFKGMVLLKNYII